MESLNEIVEKIAKTPDLLEKALKLSGLVRWRMKSPSILKVNWTWDEWQQSRAARRAVAERVGPLIVRRKESSSDRRLCAAFDGQRGPVFKRVIP